MKFAGEGRPVLDWENRVKIAAGAARGIAYLHEDCNYQPYHYYWTRVFSFHTPKVSNCGCKRDYILMLWQTLLPKNRIDSKNLDVGGMQFKTMSPRPHLLGFVVVVGSCSHKGLFGWIIVNKP